MPNFLLSRQFLTFSNSTIFPALSLIFILFTPISPMVYIPASFSDNFPQWFCLVSCGFLPQIQGAFYIGLRSFCLLLVATIGRVHITSFIPVCKSQDIGFLFWYPTRYSRPFFVTDNFWRQFLSVVTIFDSFLPEFKNLKASWKIYLSLLYYIR